MANIRIKDIAERLGISPATVSMALNDRPGVNANTRERVLALVKELNYTGTVGTVRKNATNQGVISLIIYKRYGRILADTQFFTDLLEALSDASLQEKYTLALTYCNGEENLRESINTALGANPSGVILLGTEMAEEDMGVFDILNVPMVVLDCDLMGSKYDTVTISNIDGIWQAARYLYNQGHRDIGYMRSSFAIRNFDQRLMGYEYALKSLAMPYKEDMVFFVEPTMEGAAKDVEEILSHGIKLPSAIIADNDLIALGAMRAMKQYGIRIPEDVAIIGFDDIPMAQMVEPPLASILVSRQALGHAAVELLLWRMDHPDEPRRRLSVGNAIRIRESAGTGK